METDLEFLQISCFLYEYRLNKRVTNETMEDLSEWLQNNDKLNFNVDYDTPIFVTSLSPNVSKILDIINMYSPDFPMIISISDTDKYMLKKLDFQSNSHVTYRGSGRMCIPCFHGGSISVDGEIDGLDILELIKVSKPFTTFTTCIESKHISIDEAYTSSILSELYDVIENSDDDNLYQFTLKAGFRGRSPSMLTKYIRSWKISAYVEDNVFYIRAQKD